MRCRKNSREVEAYSVANQSQYGWMTEKFYRQGELFEKESDDVWYEKDDLTTDKKLSMLRNAEREAKYAMVHCIVWMSLTVFLHEIFFFSKGSLQQPPSTNLPGRCHQDGVLQTQQSLRLRRTEPRSLMFPPVS